VQKRSERTGGENPQARNESGTVGRVGEMPAPHHPPLGIYLNDVRASCSFATRKMMIFTRLGWSPLKNGWRSVGRS